jgi:hypothetical protein
MPPTAAQAAAAGMTLADVTMAHETTKNFDEDVPMAKAKTISFADEDVDNNSVASSVDSDYSYQKKPAAAAAASSSSATSFKYKPLNNQDSEQGLRQRPPKLSYVSKMYDIDNKGYLTEEERHMREMDVEGRGYLTKEQVYDIVKSKLDEEYDVKQYKKLTCWMVGFMVLLTLCGFGTSYTSAILSKEINVDSGESAAVLVKNTDRVIGFDTISDTLEFTELSDAEYTQRKLSVLEDLRQDGMAEEHSHRKLANKRSGYTILFDQGKVSERDLESIIIRCDAGNTVNIERTWKNADGSKDVDYDTICGPEYTVVKKATPKKKGGNKNKLKVRTGIQQVVFKKGPRKNKGDDGDVVSFFCEKSWCYASGTILQQSEGHPCSIQRGHEECADGLLCYAGESITYGTGVCTRFAKNRKPGQFCDISLGLNACQGASMCEGNLKSGTVYVDDDSGKVVGMGTCSSGKMSMRMKFGEVCDASFGNDACSSGLVCMDLKGKILKGKGTGICGQKEARQPNYKLASWYVEENIGPAGDSRCVRDCPLGKFNNCGGNKLYEDELHDSWETCCKQMLWWVKTENCVLDWPVIA